MTYFDTLFLGAASLTAVLYIISYMCFWPEERIGALKLFTISSFCKIGFFLFLATIEIASFRQNIAPLLLLWLLILDYVAIKAILLRQRPKIFIFILGASPFVPALNLALTDVQNLWLSYENFLWASLVLLMLLYVSVWRKPKLTAPVRIIGVMASLSGLGLSTIALLDRLYLPPGTSFTIASPTVGLTAITLIFTTNILIFLRDSHKVEKHRNTQIAKDLDIWNLNGLLNNTSSIMDICRRLNQPSTLAIFKIHEYEELESSLSKEELERFLRGTVRSLVFCLRKHDQLALVDKNLFAVLLPFTNIEKGTTACIRLNQSLLVDQNLSKENPSVFASLRFGLTPVLREEGNIVPALKRAAYALAKPGTDSVKVHLESVE